MAKHKGTFKRLDWRQKTAAVVPLTLLSGAWLAATTTDGSATAAADEATDPGVPQVPTTPFQVPASMQLPGSDPTGIDPTAGPRGAVSTLSANGIPTAALFAYERAASILEKADPACHLDWTLVAAIGRVESDHGRYDGNVLDADGVSTPGIYGIPLDGSNGTARISDSDSGVLDNDLVWDRAVGPMQFIPTTWSVIGVDADGDGRKDPQDIDDAATATAVYLCAGEGDLSTEAGQREAVYRYNHSDDYVALVLRIARGYYMGDYTMVPNDTPSSTVLTDFDHTDADEGTDDQDKGRKDRDGDQHRGDGQDGPTDDDQPGDGTDDGPTDDGSTGDDGDDGNGDDGPTDDPTTPPGGGGDGDDDGPVDDPTGSVEDTVTELEKATAYCQAQLAGSGASGAQVNQCVQAYLDGGKAAADSVIANILDILDDVLPGDDDGPLPDLP